MLRRRNSHVSACSYSTRSIRTTLRVHLRAASLSTDKRKEPSFQTTQKTQTSTRLMTRTQDGPQRFGGGRTKTNRCEQASNHLCSASHRQAWELQACKETRRFGNCIPAQRATPTRGPHSQREIPTRGPLQRLFVFVCSVRCSVEK